MVDNKLIKPRTNEMYPRTFFVYVNDIIAERPANTKVIREKRLWSNGKECATSVRPTPKAPIPVMNIVTERTLLSLKKERAPTSIIIPRRVTEVLNMVAAGCTKLQD